MSDVRTGAPTASRKSARRRTAALLGASALALLAAPQAGAATVSPAAFTVTAVNALSESTVIHNNYTDWCLDLPGYDPSTPNTPVSTYACRTSESGDNQDFHLVPTRVVGGVQLYEFVNDKSGLCLDLPNYGSEPAGTHLYVYYCNANPANDNQEWSIWNASYGGQPMGTMIENFKSSGSQNVNPTSGAGQCLDVSGWAANNSDQPLNQPLTIYTCYNSSWGDYGFDDHLWAYGDYWAATS